MSASRGPTPSCWATAAPRRARLRENAGLRGAGRAGRAMLARIAEATSSIPLRSAATEGSETIMGSRFDDVIDALGGNDHVEGREGDDLLKGGLGADRLYGRIGDDLLVGGEGDDRLEGGRGRDRLDGGSGERQVERRVRGRRPARRRGPGHDLRRRWRARPDLLRRRSRRRLQGPDRRGPQLRDSSLKRRGIGGRHGWPNAP